MQANWTTDANVEFRIFGQWHNNYAVFQIHLDDCGGFRGEIVQTIGMPNEDRGVRSGRLGQAFNGRAESLFALNQNDVRHL